MTRLRRHDCSLLDLSALPVSYVLAMTRLSRHDCSLLDLSALPVSYGLAMTRLSRHDCSLLDLSALPVSYVLAMSRLSRHDCSLLDLSALPIRVSIEVPALVVSLFSAGPTASSVLAFGIGQVCAALVWILCSNDACVSTPNLPWDKHFETPPTPTPNYPPTHPPDPPIHPPPTHTLTSSLNQEIIVHTVRK